MAKELVEPVNFERIKAEVYALITKVRILQSNIATLSGDVVLKADTDTSTFQFVIDEDDMRSDLDTQVPTQQSVKAYVDNASIDFTHTFLLMGA